MHGPKVKIQFKMASYIVAALIVLVVVWLTRQGLQRKPKNFPPGPPGLPIIGSALTVMRSKQDPMALFSSWAKTYGDVVHFRVGPTNHVFLLNSHGVMKEAFQNPLLNGRAPSKTRKTAFGIYNNGVTPLEQRQFTHSVFRSLGVGRESYEDTVLTEVIQLSKAIDAKDEQPFDPNDLLCCSVANIICSIVFGSQYTYSDADLIEMLNRISTTSALLGTGSVWTNLPIPGLHRLPFGPLRALAREYEALSGFITGKIQDHRRTYDSNHTRDFIDIYLKKIAERKDFEQTFDDVNLKATIFDLFLAGTETTSTALEWFLIYMMTYPDVQSRVQEELDRVVGRDREPTLADRKDLPYTNAVIKESLRVACVLVLSLTHIAMEDTTLNGYSVPKGSILFGNIQHSHFDDRAWDQPNEFRPERFLNPDGSLLAKKDEWIPFGIGRRVCLGERLARMEVYLFFTGLLHRFTFKKPAHSPPFNFEGIPGITRHTHPFKTCALKRDYTF